MAIKPDPIREGDVFKFKGLASTWVVIRTQPPGIVELFCKARTHFMDTTCQQIRMKLSSGQVTKINPQ